MPIGKVKWYSQSKGFGFIEDSEGRNIYVHFTAMSGMGFKTLTVGTQVEFDLLETDRGKEASNVKFRDEEQQQSMS